MIELVQGRGVEGCGGASFLERRRLLGEKEPQGQICRKEDFWLGGEAGGAPRLGVLRDAKTVLWVVCGKQRGSERRFLS